MSQDLTFLCRHLRKKQSPFIRAGAKSHPKGLKRLGFHSAPWIWTSMPVGWPDISQSCLRFLTSFAASVVAGSGSAEKQDASVRRRYGQLWLLPLQAQPTLLHSPRVAEGLILKKSQRVLHTSNYTRTATKSGKARRSFPTLLSFNPGRTKPRTRVILYGYHYTHYLDYFYNFPKTPLKTHFTLGDWGGLHLVRW